MRRLCIGITLFLGMAVYGHTAHAAVLRVTPAESVVATGETVVIDVQLDSEAQTINSVQGFITFPVGVLEPVEISRGGSFLTLWPDEPALTQRGDAIAFTGGIPNGTIAWNAQILRITFRAVGPGVATLGLHQTKSSVLLHDGAGTRAPLTVTDATVYATALSEDGFTVQSPTHPDQAAWYRQNDVVFVFPVEAGASYAYDVSDSPQIDPPDVPQETTGTVRYGNIADGIWYFGAQERKAVGDWGGVARYRVMVDTTPPDVFTVQRVDDIAEYPGKDVLLFSATDATSGVARYDVQEGDAVYEDVQSPYVVQSTDPATLIHVRAYDNAGNVRDIALPRTVSSHSWTLLMLLGSLILLGIILLRIVRRDA